MARAQRTIDPCVFPPPICRGLLTHLPDRSPVQRVPFPVKWTMTSPPGAETVLNGHTYLYFAGTGYLGLQGHPEMIEAAAIAVRQFGVHTATSRSGFGNCPAVVEVERRAAEFLGSEASCYLVSGYAGNFAVAAALADRVQVALVDESAHECVREATRWLDGLSEPPLIYRHRDADHLAELLHKRLPRAGRAIVLTDGVFAASGHVAPLAEFLSVLEQYPGSALLVDDAHGLGVLGQQGRGSLELAGVPAARINCHDISDATAVFHTATLSKAIGGHGGIVAGSREFLDSVRRASGWFRGASAPSTPAAAATAKGLEIVDRDPSLRRRLSANVAAVRGALQGLGLSVETSPSPIIGFKLESASRMQHVQQRLLAERIAIGYTQNYAGTGPDGMLRIAVFATHTPKMIDRLVDALRPVL